MEVHLVKESADLASEKARVGTLRYGLKSRVDKEPKRSQVSTAIGP